jgi:tRNA(Arg) A34 adenosine deaminase TadA
MRETTLPHYLLYIFSQTLSLASHDINIPITSLLYDHTLNKVLALTSNRSESGRNLNNRIAHSELLALFQASRHYTDALATSPAHAFRNVTLLVTHEPCLMCTGAALQAGIKNVVYCGVDDLNGGATKHGASAGGNALSVDWRYLASLVGANAESPYLANLRGTEYSAFFDESHSNLLASFFRARRASANKAPLDIRADKSRPLLPFHRRVRNCAARFLSESSGRLPVGVDASLTGSELGVNHPTNKQF